MSVLSEHPGKERSPVLHITVDGEPLPPTLTVDAAAPLVGCSKWQAYQDIRNTGALVGVPVLHIGSRGVRIPTRPLLRALGLVDDDRDRS